MWLSNCVFWSQSHDMAKYPKKFLELCRSITAKRPRTVIDHILKHGHISTEELKNTYGYNHPPRAARDVKEHGIDLDRFSVVGSDGRKIAGINFPILTSLAFVASREEPVCRNRFGKL